MWHTQPSGHPTELTLLATEADEANGLLEEIVSATSQKSEDRSRSTWIRLGTTADRVARYQI